MGSRETREGWLLLTFETEVNGDSKRTNERSSFLVVRWACRAGTRDFCSALAAPVGPVQNIFVVTVHYFKSPSPIKLGRQPCCVASSYSVCLCWALCILHSAHIAHVCTQPRIACVSHPIPLSFCLLLSNPSLRESYWSAKIDDISLRPPVEHLCLFLYKGMPFCLFVLRFFVVI